MDSFYIWHKWSLSLEGVSRVTFISEYENLNFWQNFLIFRPCPWKKKSTVLNGFFPYLAQMITNMKGCVTYYDLWPWPISSRSFCLGLENLVCSVASTVLNGFFPYLIHMITSMRRCVACDDLWPWPISCWKKTWPEITVSIFSVVFQNLLFLYSLLCFSLLTFFCLFIVVMWLFLSVGN